MNFSPLQATDDFFDMFVGRDAELAELDSSIENGEGCVIFGRRGTGKTSLLMKAQPALRSKHPGGVFQIGGWDTLAEVEQFLAEHKEGFTEKALLIIDGTDRLKPSELTEILSTLSKLTNLQVIATASINTSLPEGYRSIALSPVDHRKVLEARLGYLAHKRGKSEEVVGNALKAIDLVAAKSTSETSPREAIQAVFDVMRTWESTQPSTAAPKAGESAPEALSESVLFAKIQNYLRTRVDYVGLAVAVGLYFLANSSNEKYQEVEEKRHSEIMAQIKLLVKSPKKTTIAYFTSARLNLRESPSTNDAVITVLPENTEIDVLNSDKIWLYVEDLVSKKKGWVHGRYVVPVIQESSNK
jgi:energy-coupling factor transporter ATP-binding protein EcfA2